MIVENAEITGYDLLIQMAKKMNFGDAIPSLRQSLEEEEKMFVWLRASSHNIYRNIGQIDLRTLKYTYLNTWVPGETLFSCS
jgi:ferritin-like metal-binding protein YciE